MQGVEQFGVCRDERVHQYLGMQRVGQFGVDRDERVSSPWNAGRRAVWCLQRRNSALIP